MVEIHCILVFKCYRSLKKLLNRIFAKSMDYSHQKKKIFLFFFNCKIVTQILTYKQNSNTLIFRMHQKHVNRFEVVGKFSFLLTHTYKNALTWRMYNPPPGNNLRYM